jgi:hypothetical protein
MLREKGVGVPHPLSPEGLARLSTSTRPPLPSLSPEINAVLRPASIASAIARAAHAQGHGPRPETDEDGTQHDGDLSVFALWWADKLDASRRSRTRSRVRAVFAENTGSARGRGRGRGGRGGYVNFKGMGEEDDEEGEEEDDGGEYAPPPSRSTRGGGRGRGRPRGGSLAAQAAALAWEEGEGADGTPFPSAPQTAGFKRNRGTDPDTGLDFGEVECDPASCRPSISNLKVRLTPWRPLSAPNGTLGLRYAADIEKKASSVAAAAATGAIRLRLSIGPVAPSATAGGEGAAASPPPAPVPDVARVEQPVPAALLVRTGPRRADVLAAATAGVPVSEWSASTELGLPTPTPDSSHAEAAGAADPDAALARRAFAIEATLRTARWLQSGHKSRADALRPLGLPPPVLLSREESEEYAASRGVWHRLGAAGAGVGPIPPRAPAYTRLTCHPWRVVLSYSSVSAFSVKPDVIKGPRMRAPAWLLAGRPVDAQEEARAAERRASTARKFQEARQRKAAAKAAEAVAAAAVPVGAGAGGAAYIAGPEEEEGEEGEDEEGGWENHDEF